MAAAGKIPNNNAPAAENDSDLEDEAVTENELTSVNITKYQAAGEIATKALAAVVAAAVDGTTVLALCTVGDSTMQTLLKAVYVKDKKMSKGIAFPTCVSPTSIICHLSPLPSDPESTLTIKTGDMVRIELGAHIDGYIGQVAHTFVVGASKENPVTGRKADVLQAAYTAAEVAVRTIKPGNTSWAVSDLITKAAKEFDCKAAEGMTTHQILRNVLDGPKQVVQNPADQSRKDIPEATFEEGEVYSIDVLICTGEGKSKTLDTRTTVFKRNPNQTYQLKMKTSRAVFSEITKNNGTMAFSLRHLEDEKKGRMGIAECVTHNLVTPYPVLHEKADVDSAHFMFTVLLMPSGQLKVSSYPWDQESVVSEHKVNDAELVEILNPVIYGL
ncbi:DNA-binding protein, 42 kDa [Batrachochytrium salamandrivorans]|nr:DNA-binding protein, 42 kDa [Batrachochytrium salamandrivorans]